MSGAQHWFIERPAVVRLLLCLWLVAGVLAISKTRQETLPNVPLDRIGVVTLLPQAAPARVEQLLCTPMENALTGIDGLTDLVSEAREGSCHLTVDVQQGYNTRAVLERVRAALETLRDLPAGAERPQVQELIVRNRVVRLLLSGDLDDLGLYRLAHRIRHELLALDAISVVDIEGLPEREIALEVPRDVLYQHRLSLADMAAALQVRTDTVPGGLLRSEDGNLLLETGRRAQQPLDYLALPLRQLQYGDTLHVGDVARLHDGFARDSMGAWLDGRPAVAIDVYRVGRQQVLDVADAVALYRQQLALPEGISVTLWQDDAAEFRERSGLLWSNGLQALVILMLVLGLALGLSLARWIALGIPVVMLGACVVLPLLGESLNTISLFAFILVLGIVVDDAIIVGESVHHQRRLGYRGREAALRGVRAVARPICYAVLTTALAFVPLLFLPGPEGALMRVVPIVAISILMLSLVESLWMLPTHLAHETERPSRLLRASDALSERFNVRLDALLAGVYRPFIRRVLRWRYVLMSAFVALLLLSAALMHTGWVNTVLFSEVASNQVVAEVVFPQGSPAHRIREELARLDSSAQRLAAEYERDTLFAHRFAEQGFRYNISNAAEPDAPHRARLSLRLAPDTALDVRRVADDWRRVHGPVRDALSVRFDASLLQTKPDIHINLYHADMATLDEMAQRLQQLLRGIEGVHEISNSLEARRDQVNLTLTDEGLQAGLTVAMLGDQVRQAVHGIVIDRLPEQDRDVPVTLRLRGADSNSLWHLRQLPVHLPGGEWAPLEVVAQLAVQDQPALIGHYDNRRHAAVTALVDSGVTSPAQVMTVLRDAMLDTLAEDYPASASAAAADWGIAGKPKAISEFLGTLGFAYLLSLIGMFFLLTVLFGTYSQPLLVMSVIPFGLVGALLGHLLLGLDMTLWSVIGVIAVSGVVINDNLVLIDEINRLTREGSPMAEAVVEAGANRFRPIMLTTATTFFGVAPLIIQDSPQAAFLVPMAVSLGFGVVFATLVTLLLVPTLLMVLDDLRRRSAKPEDDLEQAYRAGRAAAFDRQVTNPYQDEVLQAAWQAGREGR